MTRDRLDGWRCAAVLALAIWASGCTQGDQNAADGGIDTAIQVQTDLGQTETPRRAIASAAAYKGAGLARQVCAQCHDVTDGSDPPLAGNAPSFRSVANRPGMTAEALTAWLRSTHPAMPNYKFGATVTEEIVAYIMGLRAN